MVRREEIKACYEQGPEAVITLVEDLVATFQAQVEQLRVQVKELQERLALNSHNSSKPPSSNPPAQRTKSLRTASGKKPGAQPGHRGTTLQASATPDHIVEHGATTCPDCGHSVREVKGQPSGDRRQVFDVPSLKLEVTEHRLVEKECPWCGTWTVGEFPVGVAPGVQYGPQLKALAVYWVQYHLLPWQRTCEMLGDLFGQALAEGTLAAALTECAAALAKPEEEIKQALTRAPVATFDETGLYVAGQRQWVHVASTPELTHYGPHAKRGAEATEAIGILPAFTGNDIKFTRVSVCHISRTAVDGPPSVCGGGTGGPAADEWAWSTISAQSRLRSPRASGADPPTSARYDPGLSHNSRRDSPAAHSSTPASRPAPATQLEQACSEYSPTWPKRSLHRNLA
ncbi:MAG: IS66 family transposase [Deltaproteobacteria bacterium]|nr:IS66 family transposase [Deltaproteobacteria bacterium]